MKVRTAFTFTETELRTLRAALGRGGVATRKECLTFIDRAVRTAIDAAPTPKAKRRSAADVALADGVDAATRGDSQGVDAAVERLHATRYPHGCPGLCEACVKRLGLENETEQERTRRVRDNIARKFGHATSGIGQAVARG